MTRLPLLDRTHAPVAAPPADPHGPVIPLEEIDEILRLPMRRRKVDQARIELHRDRDSVTRIMLQAGRVKPGGRG